MAIRIGRFIVIGALLTLVLCFSPATGIVGADEANVDVASLLDAIKEQQKQIEELKAKVEAIKKINENKEESYTTSASGYEEESDSEDAVEPAIVVGQVDLQDVTPGTQQAGNTNIDGTGLFGKVGVSGDSGVDNLTGIELEHTGTKPRKWQVGAVGSQRKGSFAIIDETAGNKERITIDQSGRVGLARKWPQERLDVNGRVRANAFIGDGSLLTNIPSGALGIDIDSSEIVDGTIQNVDIAGNAINSSNIANGTVANADLANSAVNSAKIANGSVSNADLANNAVNSAKIADGTVANADIADNAINSAKITDGTIVDADISNTTKIAASKVQKGHLFINSAGTDGQVWKSDGIGRGKWGTDNTGGGGGLWSQGSGSDIYYNDGNVGLGTSTPKHDLDIGGSLFGLQRRDVSPNAGYLRFGDNTGWKFHIARSQESIGAPFNTDKTGALVTFQDNGNVGLGTTGPEMPLEVVYPFGKSDAGTREVFRLHSNDSSNWNELLVRVRGGSTASDRVWELQTGEDNVANAGTLALQTNGGNVGIGTASPSAKLDVNGAVKISNDTSSCTAANAGTIRFNGISFEGCIGTSWVPFTFPTPNCEPVQDADGNWYNTVLIGSQCWMAENLNVGVMINNTSAQKNDGRVEKYCYNNNPNLCTSEGGQYQWDEMMGYSTTNGTQGICPNGWHIPGDEEWRILEIELGMTPEEAISEGWRGTDQGDRLKTAAGCAGGVNCGTSGFEALLMGGGPTGYFWSSTRVNENAWERELDSRQARVKRSGAYFKSNGFSVRCVKD